jgi:hypothetical protein
MSAAFLEKLHSMGLIPTKWNLENCDKITASSFCRRRLPVLMVWKILIVLHRVPCIKIFTDFVNKLAFFDFFQTLRFRKGGLLSL